MTAGYGNAARRVTLPPPLPKKLLSKNATTNCILPTVVYRRSCSMIAVRLGAASVMPVDLLLWARWAILEGRLAPDRPGGGQRAPACSMGNMGSPIGIVDVTSCGGCRRGPGCAAVGVMGQMGNMGSRFFFRSPLQRKSFIP